MCATSAESSDGQPGLQVGQVGGFADGALGGEPAVRPDPSRSCRLAAWSAGSATRSAVRSAASFGVRRRPQRGDPGRQGAGPFGPLEDDPGLPSAIAPRSPSRARCWPWPTAEVCRSRLPKVACQAVQLGRAPAWRRSRTRFVLRPAPRRARRAPRGSAAGWSPASSRWCAPWRSATAASARSLRRMLSRAACSASRSASSRWPEPRSFATSSSALRKAAGVLVPSSISAMTATARARVAQTSRLSASNRRAACWAIARARCGSSATSVRARISSHSACNRRSFSAPYAAAAVSRRLGRLAGPPGGEQHLGPVLLDRSPCSPARSRRGSRTPGPCCAWQRPGRCEAARRSRR